MIPARAEGEREAALEKAHTPALLLPESPAEYRCTLGRRTTVTVSVNREKTRAVAFALGKAFE